MRHLKLYKIFESSIPYTFIKSEENTYHFDDEFGNKFKVEISTDSDECEIKYYIKDDDKWTYKEVKTNIFRVIETILGQIIIDFISNNNFIKSIKIIGLGKDMEKENITQRTKAYLRYLTQNPIEGWKLDRYGNEIYLDKI